MCKTLKEMKFVFGKFILFRCSRDFQKQLWANDIKILKLQIFHLSWSSMFTWQVSYWLVPSHLHTHSMVQGVMGKGRKAIFPSSVFLLFRRARYRLAPFFEQGFHCLYCFWTMGAACRLDKLIRFGKSAEFWASEPRTIVTYQQIWHSMPCKLAL